MKSLFNLTKKLPVFLNLRTNCLTVDNESQKLLIFGGVAEKL
jgi:hypothetical protein